MTKTLIFVLTVTGNEHTLQKCLTSISANTPEDNFGIMVYKHDYKGFAVGMNHGLRILQNTNDYDSIILISDDVVVKPNWLTLFRTAMFNNPNDGIIGPNLELRGDTHVAFYCVLITKRCVNNVGLLDEQFIYGEWEDVDYCLRALYEGFTISCVGKSVCGHEGSHTLKKMSDEKKELIKQNKQLFKEKWKGTKYENKW